MQAVIELDDSSQRGRSPERKAGRPSKAAGYRVLRCARIPNIDQLKADFEDPTPTTKAPTHSQGQGCPPRRRREPPSSAPNRSPKQSLIFSINRASEIALSQNKLAEQLGLKGPNEMRTGKRAYPMGLRVRIALVAGHDTTWQFLKGWPTSSTQLMSTSSQRRCSSVQ